MGAQKNVPKKQKVKLLGLTCLFVKRKFDEARRTTANVERWFSILTFLLTKLQNTLTPNSLDKLMQQISMEPHIYDLDRDEITDLDKFLKKPHSVVLSWCNFNYSHLKILKLKIYCSSLFLVISFCALMNRFWYIHVFSLPFFLNTKSQIFPVSFFEKCLELIKDLKGHHFAK